VTVEAVHGRGLEVMVWTVDDPGRALELAGAGVDAICTNDPSGIVQAFAAGGDGGSGDDGDRVRDRAQD
jgi:glycerophosphoryl diester phosphodiesterase